MTPIRDAILDQPGSQWSDDEWTEVMSFLLRHAPLRVAATDILGEMGSLKAWDDFVAHERRRSSSLGQRGVKSEPVSGTAAIRTSSNELVTPLGQLIQGWQPARHRDLAGRDGGPVGENTSVASFLKYVRMCFRRYCVRIRDRKNQEVALPESVPLTAVTLDGSLAERDQQRRQLERLEAAMKQLTAKEREAIQLTLDGQTNLPVHVRVAKNRAIQHLRRLMGQEGT